MKKKVQNTFKILINSFYGSRSALAPRHPVLLTFATRLVSDNGKGLKETKTRGMGLHNMKYRANVIGGELTFRPRNGGGTSVCCRLGAAKDAGRPRR